MEYVALKPIKVRGTQYYIDDEIPEDALEAHRIKTLVTRGDIFAKRKKGRKAKESEETKPPEGMELPEGTKESEECEQPEGITDENITVKNKKAKKAGDA
jgi:hypothetical protein